MIAINPWLKALPVGFLAFCLGCSAGFASAVILANAVWIALSLKFSKDQQAYESRLLFRQRLYNMDLEQTIAQIQRAMANVWLNESHWQNRVVDLTNSYLLYRYEWREPESLFDKGQVRHHANLLIECHDRSDAAGAKTLAKFAFDGLPNLASKHIFYEAVHVAMGSLDAHLPDHTIPEYRTSDSEYSTYADKEMGAA